MVEPRRIRRALLLTLLVTFVVYAGLVVGGGATLGTDAYDFFQTVANIWLVLSVLALLGLGGWWASARISTSGTKVCQRCAERVRADAQVCRYCGTELPLTT